MFLAYIERVKRRELFNARKESGEIPQRVPFDALSNFFPGSKLEFTDPTHAPSHWVSRSGGRRGSKVRDGACVWGGGSAGGVSGSCVCIPGARRGAHLSEPPTPPHPLRHGVRSSTSPPVPAAHSVDAGVGGRRARLPTCPPRRGPAVAAAAPRPGGRALPHSRGGGGRGAGRAAPGVGLRVLVRARASATRAPRLRRALGAARDTPRHTVTAS